MFKCSACDKNLLVATPITLPCAFTVCSNCLSVAIGGHSTASLKESAEENTTLERSNAVPVPRSEAHNGSDEGRVATASGSFHSLDEALRLRRSSSNVSSTSSSAPSPIAQALQTERFVYDCPVKECNTKRHLYREERVDFLLQTILQTNKEPTEEDFDCPVCFDLLINPVTTSCGHTMCRKCLLESIDNSSAAIKCPQCRRPLCPQLFNRPANRLLKGLIMEKFPEQYAARETALASAENSSEAFVPIFVCSLAFPRTQIFLHIFEQRYRLMIHRAMQGNKKFGIVLPTRNGRGYMEYGTMIDITSVQAVRGAHEDAGALPRFLVQGFGTYRFRVKERAILDDYNTALIERIEDDADDLDAPDEGEGSFVSLMAFCMSHINSVLAQMTLMERRQFAASHGEMPPITEPSDFSFWLANILPVYDYQKYSLLKMTSARERLTCLAGWIKEEIEAPSRRNRCDLM
jgi:Lon protease-like protein